jgi:uncharacterized protein YndB with AHSA1/START domain
MDTDRIEKKILLHAPLARVWRALADSTEFGAWFGMKVDGPFRRGGVVHGTITGTTVDPEVARMQKQHEGLPFEITIEEMQPERVFSFRWHPHAIEQGVDYSGEPTTLVTFALEPREDGVLLTLTESGFDRIPLARRAQAFSSNEQGWEIMTKLMAKYVAEAP